MGIQDQEVNQFQDLHVPGQGPDPEVYLEQGQDPVHYLHVIIDCQEGLMSGEDPLTVMIVEVGVIGQLTVLRGLV